MAPAFPGNSFVGCGSEDSTSDVCTGADVDLETPYIFDRGTVEIKNDGRVGLKIDAIQLRHGETCPPPDPQDPQPPCFCSNSQIVCNVSTDCSGGIGGPCVPAQKQVWARVEIWAEGYWTAHPLLPSPCDQQDCVRRSTSSSQCHKTFDFQLLTRTGDINAISSSSEAFICGSTISGGPSTGVIRRVEVLIKDVSGVWRLFARGTWDPSINTGFQD